MPLNLKKIRELMGDRTQEEVAKASKMLQPALARVLSGKFDPKLSTVEKLAKALRCDVHILLKK